VEECGPCPVFASYTLAIALQLRKKHGKTSVRMENPQSAWKKYQSAWKKLFSVHRQLLVAFIFHFVSKEVTHWVADCVGFSTVLNPAGQTLNSSYTVNLTRTLGLSPQ
jgi:hypothetical protein